MSSSLQDILTELYSLSPELKKQEDAIIRIIEKMQNNKPHIEMNEIFREQLKEKILREFEHSKIQKHSASLRSVGHRQGWFSRSWFLGFGSAFGVGLAGFLIAIPILGLFQKNVPQEMAMGGIGNIRNMTENRATYVEKSEAPTAMMSVQSPATDASGVKISPYLEYIYTGSLDFIPKDLKSYKQLYPSEEAKIADYPLVENWGEPLEQHSFDPNHIEEIHPKKLTESQIRDHIAKGGDETNMPEEGQKKVQIPLANPTMVYIRVPTYSSDGTLTGQNYLPAVLFQVVYNGTQRVIVVPLVETPNQ